MLKIINVPKVDQCTVGECSYNANNACHAIAITVGDGENAWCDTYFKSATHCDPKRTAGVGACKVSKCRHNKDFECSASQIQVGNRSNQSSCLSFATA